MGDINSVKAGEASYSGVSDVSAPTRKSSATEKKPAMEVAEKDAKDKDATANGFRKSTVKNAIDTANDSLKANRTSARFKYHEATKQVSIKIIDDETQEVIKEIPPEKSIEMVEKMLELSGILVDEKR